MVIETQLSQQPEEVFVASQYPKSTWRTGLLPGVKSNVPETKCPLPVDAMQDILRINWLVICTEKGVPFAEVPLAEPVTPYSSSAQIKGVLSPARHSRVRVDCHVTVP